MPKLRPIVVIGILTAAIIGVSFAYKNSANTPATVKKQAATSSYPVTPTNPKVTSTFVRYAFAGSTIKDIKSTTNGIELTTSLKYSGVNAQFVVTKNTQVAFLAASGKETAARSTDIKKNQAVRITAEYNVKTKAWKTLKVGILPATSAASSSSPSAKTP